MPAEPRRHRKHAMSSLQALRVTRIIQSADLPDGVNALASEDRSTVIVRAGLDKAARRRALAEIYRCPRLVLWPALAGVLRRPVAVASRAVAHAVAVVTPDSPVVAALGAAAIAAAAAGAVAVSAGPSGGPVTRRPVYASSSAPGRAAARTAPRRAALAGAGRPGPSPSASTPPAPPATPSPVVTAVLPAPLASALPTASATASLPAPPSPVPTVSICVQVSPLGACLGG